MALHQELSKQANIVEEAEKYQQERNEILADNQNLHNQAQQLEKEYTKKKRKLDYEYDNLKNELENEYYDKLDKIDRAYRSEIHDLKKENKFLKKMIDKFKITINRFIKWICHKFSIPEEEELVRSFEKETCISLDVEKQLEIEKQKKEKEWDLER